MRFMLPVFALFALPALAAEPVGAMADPCEHAVDTVSFNQCSATEFGQAQSQMRMTLDAVRAKWQGSGEALAALAISQEKWEASYQADVDARFAEVDAARARGEEVGSAYLSAHNWYEASLVRDRTKWLCDLLAGPAYGEREQASCGELVMQYQTFSKN